MTDEVVDLFDEAIATAHGRARRRLIEKKLETATSQNEKVRLLAELLEIVLDPAIPDAGVRNAIWEREPPEVLAQVAADAKRIARPADDNHYPQLDDSYSHVRTFAPRVLEVLSFSASPAARELLDAVELLRDLNRSGRRTVPADAPVSFAPASWRKLIVADGADRPPPVGAVRALRAPSRRCAQAISGLQGSRRYQPIDSYLIPRHEWQRRRSELAQDLEKPLDFQDRLRTLARDLETEVAALDRALSEDPQVEIDEDGQLRLLDPEEDEEPPPPEETPIGRILAPRITDVDIPDLLVDINHLSGFMRPLHARRRRRDAHAGDRAAHLRGADRARLQPPVLKDGEGVRADQGQARLRRPLVLPRGDARAGQRRDRRLHLQPSARPADRRRQLQLLRWPPRAGHRPPQPARTGAAALLRARPRRHLLHLDIRPAQPLRKPRRQNQRCGTRPTCSTGSSITRPSFRSPSTPPTPPATRDLIFGLFDLLELDFCPHLAGLPDRRLYHLPGMRHDTPAGRLLDHPINTKLIAEHWDELLRIAASIKHGHVTASLLVQRLQAHPNRSQLARALQEYGRIIKTRFILRYHTRPEERKAIRRQLNKHESMHALHDFLFYGNDGKLRLATLDRQSTRASCLHLVANAIVAWNLVAAQHALDQLRSRRQSRPARAATRSSPRRSTRTSTRSASSTSTPTAAACSET